MNRPDPRVNRLPFTADDILRVFFFSFFSEQNKIICSVDDLHLSVQQTIYIKCQVFFFSLKNNKINLRTSSAVNMLNALRVKHCLYEQRFFVTRNLASDAFSHFSKESYVVGTH